MSRARLPTIGAEMALIFDSAATVADQTLARSQINTDEQDAAIP